MSSGCRQAGGGGRGGRLQPLQFLAQLFREIAPYTQLAHGGIEVAAQREGRELELLCQLVEGAVARVGA